MAEKFPELIKMKDHQIYEAQQIMKITKKYSHLKIL